MEACFDSRICLASEMSQKKGQNQKGQRQLEKTWWRNSKGGVRLV
jgi:hypothetical protein